MAPQRPQTPEHAAVLARLAEIRELRLAGLPRRFVEVARDLGVDQGQLHRELTGRRPLRPERLDAIATTLGLEPADLRARAESLAPA